MYWISYFSFFCLESIQATSGRSVALGDGYPTKKWTTAEDWRRIRRHLPALPQDQIRRRIGTRLPLLQRPLLRPLRRQSRSPILKGTVNVLLRRLFISLFSLYACLCVTVCVSDGWKYVEKAFIFRTGTLFNRWFAPLLHLYACLVPSILSLIPSAVVWQMLCWFRVSLPLHLLCSTRVANKLVRPKIKGKMAELAAISFWFVTRSLSFPLYMYSKSSSSIRRFLDFKPWATSPSPFLNCSLFIPHWQIEFALHLFFFFCFSYLISSFCLIIWFI